jgi:hypothetical protein
MSKAMYPSGQSSSAAMRLDADPSIQRKAAIYETPPKH